MDRDTVKPWPERDQVQARAIRRRAARRVLRDAQGPADATLLLDVLGLTESATGDGSTA